MRGTEAELVAKLGPRCACCDGFHGADWATKQDRSPSHCSSCEKDKRHSTRHR